MFRDRLGLGASADVAEYPLVSRLKMPAAWTIIETGHEELLRLDTAKRGIMPVQLGGG